MITDSETNFLYLAVCLKQKKYSAFLQRFETTLKENSIIHEFLDNTKDIWAVDYMPIQITKEKFVQFIYDPDYLHCFKLEDTITDTSLVPQATKFLPTKSSLKVEGGNVIRGDKKIITCDKILKDNITWKNSQTKIIDELLNVFQVEEIIFIPTQRDDFIGHADGIIRFIDDDNVIINDLKNKVEDFKNDFISALKKSKRNYSEIPYNILNAKSDWDARGIYINYLQMKDIIFVPMFDFKEEDDLAEKTLSKFFSKSTIVPVLCNEIAKDGGILNCICWNILINK